MTENKVVEQMSENNALEQENNGVDTPTTENDGIAILPATEDRPMGIVDMGTGDDNTETIKSLSDQLNKIDMEHVVMTVADAEKEGISKEQLLESQKKMVQNTINNHTKPKVKGNSNKIQQTFKRKKKGKKTHRRKR